MDSRRKNIEDSRQDNEDDRKIEINACLFAICLFSLAFVLFFSIFTAFSYLIKPVALEIRLIISFAAALYTVGFVFFP